MNATSRLYSDVIGQLKKHFRIFAALSTVIAFIGGYMATRAYILGRKGMGSHGKDVGRNSGNPS